MKKEYIITIVLGGLLVLEIFYWFAWRPSSIKKFCYNRAKTGAVNSYRDSITSGYRPLYAETFNQDVFDKFYNNCLLESGL